MTERPSASAGGAGAANEAGGTCVREALSELSRSFREAGMDQPEVDARRLMAEALDLTAADLLKEPDRILPPEACERLRNYKARRLAHEPVSRILGYREFFGRRFAIDASTLDPRPDTETLVETALEIARGEGWTEKPIRILDVGTGSGALLVTLLAELPLATGLGTDISEAALAVAAANADRHEVGSRARFERRRSLEGVAGPFDLMVSNPPYIPSGDIDGLEVDVRSYDPRPALDGGTDGLQIYRELASGLLGVVPDGWVLVEVGAGQAPEVARLLETAAGRAAGPLRRVRDLGGHERCVALRTHPVLGTG